MSTTTDRDEAAVRGNQALRSTLRTVMSYRNVNATQLHHLSGVPYNTVQRYTGGDGQLTGGYLEIFAKALRVPRFVLAMDADDALKWVLDNAPNGSLAATPELATAQGGSVTLRYPEAVTGQQLALDLDGEPRLDCVHGAAEMFGFTTSKAA